MMVRPQAYIFWPPIIVPHCLALQDNCSHTTMIEDACAIIVQAAAFTATKILHKEESSVSSRAGRIVVVHVWRSVHKVYCCLGSSYFQRAYRNSIIYHLSLSRRYVNPSCRRRVLRQEPPTLSPPASLPSPLPASSPALSLPSLPPSSPSSTSPTSSPTLLPAVIRHRLPPSSPRSSLTATAAAVQHNPLA